MQLSYSPIPSSTESLENATFRGNSYANVSLLTRWELQRNFDTLTVKRKSSGKTELSRSYEDAQSHSFKEAQAPQKSLWKSHGKAANSRKLSGSEKPGRKVHPTPWAVEPAINHILMMVGNGSCCSSRWNRIQRRDIIMLCISDWHKERPHFRFKSHQSVPISIPASLTDRKWGIYQFRPLPSCRLHFSYRESNISTSHSEVH